MAEALEATAYGGVLFKAVAEVTRSHCLRDTVAVALEATAYVMRWLRLLEATTYGDIFNIIVYIMKGYMYILLCSDGSYYTGSTNDLERRLEQHQNGEGANHTKKRLPVSLLYYEEYQRIDEAFYREKQVQGWSRKKKEALIEGNVDLLPELAKAYRDLPSSGLRQQ